MPNPIEYRVRLFNQDLFEKALKDYNENLGAVLPHALEKACEAYFEAADWLIPLDTGALRRSRGITQRNTGWRHVTYMGYGYEIMELYIDALGRIKVPRLYAVYQHEVPMNHKEGIDHYLEEGLAYYADLIMDVIQKEFEKVKP